MELKIVTDGTPRGTLVVDADTGEQIRNVKVLELRIDHEGATARMEFIAIDVELRLDLPRGYAEGEQRG